MSLSGRSSSVPDSIRRYLDQVRLRIRLWLALDGFARLLAWIPLVWLASLLVDYALDRWGEWDGPLRQWVSVLWWVAVVWTLVRTLGRRLISIPGRTAIARSIEARHPALAGRLLSSLEQATSGRDTSTELAQEAGRQAAELLRSIPPQTPFAPWRSIRRLSLSLLVVGLALGLLSQYPAIARTWFARVVQGKADPYPRWTALAWSDHQEPVTKVGRGRDREVELIVGPGSIDPGEVRVDARDPRGGRQQYLMTPLGPGRYRLLLRQVRDDLELRARGGDGRTAWRTLQVVDPPVIESAELTIEPPAYTRLGSSKQPWMGSPISVPAHSRVQARLVASKPIASAQVTAGSDVLASHLAEARAITFEISLEQPRSIRVNLVDRDGIDLTDPFPMALVPVEDNPPSADLSLPRMAPVITPSAMLPMRVQAGDDFGLGRVTIHARTDARVILERAPISGEPPWGKQIDQTERLDTADWSLQPGDKVSVRIEAADENDVTGPGRTLSGEVKIEVVSIDEWLSRLTTRELQLRQRMEQVVRELADAKGGLERTRDLSPPPKEEKDSADTPRRLALDRARSTLRKDLGEAQAIGLAFSDLANEINYNRIDNPSLLARIEEGVVAPIDRWVREPFPATLAQAEQVADPPTPESIAALIGPLEQLVLEGEKILSAMRKLESFQEVVTMLRAIMEDQGELRRTLESREKKRVLDLLQD